MPIPAPLRALLLGALCLLAPCLAAPAADVGIGAGEPVLDPPMFRLGDVGHREERVVAFALTNPGDTPLEITEVRPSCSCLEVSFDESPIPAGGKREGTAKVSFGRGFGNFHKQVDFTLAGHRSPLVLHLYANFHPGIRVDALELVLDAHLGGGGPRPSTVYEIRSVSPKGPPPEVTELLVERSDQVTARLLEPAIERARIEIAAAATHPEGVIGAEVTAKVNGRLLVLPVRGTVHRGIRLEPAQVNFNVVRAPEDRIERIELIPVDGRPFELGAIRYEPRRGSIAVTPEIAPLPREDGGWTLELKLPPGEATGGFGGTVFVATDHPEKPEVVITVFGHIP
jgi:hypothetical protein